MSKVVSAISIQCTAAAVVEYVRCPKCQRLVLRTRASGPTAQLATSFNLHAN